MVMLHSMKLEHICSVETLLYQQSPQLPRDLPNTNPERPIFSAIPFLRRSPSWGCGILLQSSA
ncbi:unnamed protein product [Brassica rapa subsp. narinosa]|uniref:(rape) hypothetical protein n=1 Tax=Brassica napus TaxID=3708 RepID=A0A817B2Z5_BRANA|nr:unnamed protein product [Brassica napus]